MCPGYIAPWTFRSFLPHLHSPYKGKESLSSVLDWHVCQCDPGEVPHHLLGFECLIGRVRLGTTQVVPKHSTGHADDCIRMILMKIPFTSLHLNLLNQSPGAGQKGTQGSMWSGLGTDSLTETSGCSWYARLEITDAFRAGGKGEAREPSTQSVPTLPAPLWHPKRRTMAWTRMSSLGQQQIPTGVWRAWDPERDNEEKKRGKNVQMYLRKSKCSFWQDQPGPPYRVTQIARVRGIISL